MTTDRNGLSVEQISKRFGETRALDDVSLHVAPGAILALLGNNGAGKSTLMSICAGLLRPDGGRVVVDGDTVTGTGGRSSANLGLAPQGEALYPSLTVRRNLEYFGTLAGLDRATLARRVDDVAQRLMIDGLLERKAKTLSGGQRRQLHTGLALMHSPSVLLLDEPTVGVDIETRAGLMGFVRRTAASGTAILYSTHQLHEVEALDADVVIIDHGRVLAAGSVAELVARHAHPLGELRFAGPLPELPTGLVGRIETTRAVEQGESSVVVRLASDDTHITEIVGQLGDDARAALRAAVAMPADLEQAYVRVTNSARRSHDGTAS